MLLVVVLIWDDVVEIGLFGSTLRKKTEELQRGQEHLAQQPTLLVPALDVRKANEALEEKSKQWLETPTAGPPR